MYIYVFQTFPLNLIIVYAIKLSTFPVSFCVSTMVCLMFFFYKLYVQT